ncbi:MAG: hypothetical protein WAW62_01200 [Candidatus Saccharimonas aalborgensis]
MLPQEPTAPVEKDPTQLPHAPNQNDVKKSRKKLIIGIVAGVSALILAGTGTALALIYQQPEKVVSDAIMNLMSARVVQSKTTITSNWKVDGGESGTFTIKRLTFDSRASTQSLADENAEVEFTWDGKDYTTKGAAYVADSGDIYFKLSGIKEILSKLASKYTGNPSLPQKAQDDLDKIDGKWAKYTLQEMKTDAPDAAKTYSCLIDAYKRIGRDKAATEEIKKLYLAHPFMKLSGTTKNKDGLNGYEITIDKAKASDFSTAMKTTAYFKAVDACNPSTEALSSASGVDQAMTVDSMPDLGPTVTLWVDPWSHTLRRVDAATVVKGAQQDGKDLSLTMVSDLTYDQSVVSTPPRDTMTAKEWVTSFSDFVQDVEPSVVSGSMSITAKANTTTAQTNANMVIKKAEVYYALEGEYPATIADFAKNTDSRLDDPSFTVVSTPPSNKSTIQYVRCGTDAGKVVYYDETKMALVTRSLSMGGC